MTQEVIAHEVVTIGTDEIQISQNRSLSEYIKKVNTFPVLTEAEEKTLLSRFFNEQDISAGHQILNSHLRLVVKIAFEYKRYQAQLLDLIAEGNLGLMKALRNFSLEKNVRFSTYAMLWVKAAMKEFLLRANSIVKIGTTSSKKRILFGLNRVKKHLGVTDVAGYEHNLPKIANMLNVKQAELREVTNALHNVAPNSIDATLSDEGGGTYGDSISGNFKNGEDIAIEQDSSRILKTKLQEAFKGLNERETLVLEHRILGKKKLTLAELSTKLGVSKERIRQIEELALKKMRSILKQDEEIFKYVK